MMQKGKSEVKEGEAEDSVEATVKWFIFSLFFAIKVHVTERIIICQIIYIVHWVYVADVLYVLFLVVLLK